MSYELFLNTLNKLKDKFTDLELSLDSEMIGENRVYFIKLTIDEKDFNIEEKFYFNLMISDEVTALNVFSLKIDKFLKKAYYLQKGISPEEYDLDIIAEIKELADESLKGICDFIMIKESSYSSSYFRNYIVYLAKDKQSYLNSSDPTVYISLYEFFYSTLFNTIYGEDLEKNVNEKLANKWTDINSLIIRKKIY